MYLLNLRIRTLNSRGSCPLWLRMSCPCLGFPLSRCISRMGRYLHGGRNHLGCSRWCSFLQSSSCSPCSPWLLLCFPTDGAKCYGLKLIYIIAVFNNKERELQGSILTALVFRDSICLNKMPTYLADCQGSSQKKRSSDWWG